MVNSILTNPGSMTALASLQKTQKALRTTQDRISTGLKVGTAKDNAATWAISSAMRSDISNYKQVSENLSLSSSIVGTARTASESISDLVSQIRTKVTSAQNSAVDKSQVQNDIDQLVGQIQGIVDAAQFKGVNLVNGTGTEKVLSSVNNVGGTSSPAYIDVTKKDLKVEGGTLSDLSTIDVTSRGDQLFDDAEMGTVRFKFDNAGDHTAGTYTVSYNDANGDAQTVTVTLAGAKTTGADLATALNANENFAATFLASDASGDAVYIQAKSRDVETGDFAITGVSGSALTAAIASTAAETSTTMTFEDEPLKMGETFSVSFKVNGGAETTVKLQVAEATSGTSLGQDEDGNQIYAINADVVSDNAATGINIAAEVRSALLGNSNFAAAAADGTKLGVAVDGAGGLTIDTVDGTDTLVSFEPPETDYATLLSTLDTLASTVDNAATAFGSAQSRIEMQKEFVDGLTRTLTAGVGNLVDADMSEEAARLTALQVQEQLGTQALSIANQAPQNIMSLFR